MGLVLRKADNQSGYAHVSMLSGKRKPFKAAVWRGDLQVYLGCFATAEEAALCVARSPEGRAAAERASTAPPTASSEQGKSKAPAKPSVKEEGSVRNSARAARCSHQGGGGQSRSHPCRLKLAGPTQSSRRSTRSQTTESGRLHA